MAVFADVFARELEEIANRRRLLGLEPVDASRAPSPSLGLTALAFSGGGIRSAAFCLGVLQSFARAGIVRTVDYLSSVSGGGYIASCLESLMNDPRSGACCCEPDRFPLRKDSGVPETVVLSHLRNSGSYLGSGGLIDKLRIATLALRGILLNMLLLFPMLSSAAFVTGIAYHFQGASAVRQAPILFVVLWLGGLFLLLVVTFPFISRIFSGRFNWSRRNDYELVLTFALALFLGSVLLLPLAVIVDNVLLYPWSTFHLSSLLTLRYWPLWTSLAGISLLLLIAGPMAATSRAAWSLLLYGIGMLGPVVVLATYLLFCIQWVRIPYLSLSLVDELSLAAEHSETQSKTLGRSRRQRVESGLAGELQRRGLVDSMSEPIEVNRVPPAKGEEGERWSVQTRSRTFVIQEASDRLVIVMNPGDSPILPGWPLAALSLVFLLINHLLLDVNLTSPHGFYRDRLSKAFLFQLAEDNEIQPTDSLKLSELNQPGTAAPYHLINAALNLEGSRRPGLRGRNADFFLFSKHFIGSESTGYSPTHNIEMVDTHLNLGTAMAISAGAAAPNMGATTLRPLMFVLTLLNIRLGYWLPNPLRLAEGVRPGQQHYFGHAGAIYVMRESLGLIDERGRRINVSDGGHIENLGIYELLRRRAKLIIAVDGEADPKLSFSSLINLIRYAHIDMGIRIEINLDAIRHGTDHYTVGTIEYGSGEKGELLYIKASKTGDENPYVLDYAARYPAFPHESTTDQFFGEAQFEAYRALGYHIAHRALAALPQMPGIRAASAT